MKKLVVHFRDGATPDVLHNIKSITIENSLMDTELVIEDAENSWHYLDNIEYIEVKDD